MGGRGSSSATASSAPQTVKLPPNFGLPPQQQQQPQQQPPQVANMPLQGSQPTVTAGATTDLAALQAMSPTAFARQMGQYQNADNPISAVLYDSPVQRMIYDAGINGKPEVVDPRTFASLPGQSIYRTVNSNYDRSNDVNHPADRIARQTMQSAYNRIGGGVYGDGHYFSGSRSTSTMYGNTSGNVAKTAVMEAKLNGNAKVVTYNGLKQMLSNEPRSLQSAMRKPNYRGGSYSDPDNNLSAYALYKGYNVIMTGGVYVVIDRSALTFNSRVTAM